MKFIYTILCLATLSLVGLANANADETLASELSLNQYFAEDSNNSYLSADLFTSRQLNPSTGVFLFAYHDPNYQAIFAGVSHRLKQVELGLGAGQARTENDIWFVWHPWLYYEDDQYRLYIYAEYTPRAASDRFFYKVEAARRLTDRMSAGVFSEKFFGIGPLATVQLTESVEIQATLPIFDRDDDIRMRGLVGLKVYF